MAVKLHKEAFRKIGNILRLETARHTVCGPGVGALARSAPLMRTSNGFTDLAVENLRKHVILMGHVDGNNQLPYGKVNLL